MKRSIIVACLVVALLLPAVMASAAVNGPLSVVVSNGSGKWASWSYNWANGLSYNLASPVQLRATDGTHLATINSLSCAMNSDPFLTLNFAVQAVGDANFFFDTGELLFPVINQPVAFATAAATLTADASNATLTGLFSGGKAYEATYNGGTVFADLVGTFNAPATTSTTQTERVPPGAGFVEIGVPVSSMRAQWSFSLTAGDGASGTSRFEIEPIPDAGTLALALTGAVPLLGVAIRRRRRA